MAKIKILFWKLWWVSVGEFMKQKLLQGFKYSLFSPFMYSLWRGKKKWCCPEQLCKNYVYRHSLLRCWYTVTTLKSPSNKLKLHPLITRLPPSMEPARGIVPTRNYLWAQVRNSTLAEIRVPCCGDSAIWWSCAVLGKRTALSILPCVVPRIGSQWNQSLPVVRYECV